MRMLLLSVLGLIDLLEQVLLFFRLLVKGKYLPNFSIFSLGSSYPVYTGTDPELFRDHYNAWKLVADIDDIADPVATPVLISKNVNIKSLSDMKASNDSLAAHLGNPALYDNKRVIIIVKGQAGTVHETNYEGLNLNNQTNTVLWAGDETPLSAGPVPTHDDVKAQLPDFQITSITLEPPSPKAGDLFTATLLVYNDSSSAGEPGTLSVWLDRSGEASGVETGDTNVVVEAIGARASALIKIADLKAPEKQGKHTFRAFIDSKEMTKEKSESNNQRSKEFECK